MSDYHILNTYNYNNGHGGTVRMPGTEDWVTVAELGDGGYEWTEFKTFYSPSQRRYFWHGGSGCSCNSWSDDIGSAADFENGDRDSMIKAWETFTKEHSYDFNVTDYLDGVKTLRGFKPPVSSDTQ